MSSHLWGHFSTLGNADLPVIVRGEGCYLEDRRGCRYLDGLSGLFTVQVGHGRGELADAGAQEALLSGILPGRAVATLGTTGLGDLTLVGGHLSTILAEGFLTGGGRVHAVSWDRLTAG
ncbi:MAG: hypothetical protein ACOYOP_02090 [Microthrixaceae bacterium]